MVQRAKDACFLLKALQVRTTVHSCSPKSADVVGISLQNVIVVRPVKNQTIRVLTSSGALVECVYGNANSGAFIDLPGLET